MHITTSQKGNLLVMLVGFSLLLGAYFGLFAFEHGWIGAASALCCIAFGLKTFYELHQQRFLELPEYAGDPALKAFYRRTRELWLSENFRFYGEQMRRKIRNQTPAQFGYELRPIKGNPMALFLERGAPLREGECMVGFGDLGELYDPKPYYVLTSHRWFQKLGEPDDIRWEMLELSGLASVEFESAEYGTARLRFHSGETKTWEGLAFFPKEELLDFAIELASELP